ncbi:MAG: Holliday junction resolvase RuvX [Deltaproteobacteria bacterium]|nr:Holliday junction resolvase RuvX [Deltaproteobacteria bacterium]
MPPETPARGRRVLGIDLGLKRTGLAVSDELGLSVRPLPNLTPQSRAEDVAFLVEQVRSLEVSDVLVGQPKSGAIEKRAPGFAAALQEALRQAGLGACVHLVDEDFSSRDAAARLVESGVKKSERKAALDSEAARGLVLAFLQRRAPPP